MNINDDDRIIHTGLYTKKAFDVMSSVFGQCSDGAYENNPRYDRYWKFGDAFQEVDGEVTIHVSAKSGECEHYGRWVENAFFKMSDVEVKTWMANMVKRIMQMELRDKSIANGWRRDNTDFTTCYLNRDEDINVAEVYCIYELLLGGQVGITKYDVHVIASVLGCKRQPSEIEAETKKREHARAIDRTYAEAVKQLNEDEKREIDELNAKIEAVKKMYATKRNEAWHHKMEMLKTLEA